MLETYFGPEEDVVAVPLVTGHTFQFGSRFPQPHDPRGLPPMAPGMFNFGGK